MMLLMLVSLSTLSQYPTTKKIKGEQVVIMTVKQAEGINNKFEQLEDSIIGLNNQLNGCETSLNFTQNKLENTETDLIVTQDSLEKTHNLYTVEVKRQDKLEFINRRERLRINIGLIFIGFVWVYGVISSK